MRSELPFLCAAAGTLAAAAAAMTLRNLVHAALCAAAAFAGLAVIYLQLGAEFAGLAQALVYVGAVAVLIVFTILLTNGDEAPRASSLGPVGLAAAGLVTGGLILPLYRSPSLHREAIVAAPVTVKDIGTQLMTVYVVPLEAIALLLTAALIGAVVLAVRENKETTPPPARAPRREQPEMAGVR